MFLDRKCLGINGALGSIKSYHPVHLQFCLIVCQGNNFNAGEELDREIHYHLSGLYWFLIIIFYRQSSMMPCRDKLYPQLDFNLVLIFQFCNANDTLIVMPAYSSQLHHLKELVGIFSKASYLKVNYHESNLIPIKLELF